MFDLDIEKIDKAADDEGGLTQIATEIDSVYKKAPYYQERMAYTWTQNIHFLLGDQHIYYNTTSRQFDIIPTTRNNNFIPRPVTNLIQPITTTIVSNLSKNKPNCDVSPNSSNEKDISAARIASKIQDLKWEEDNEQEKLVESLMWAVTCGTVIRKDYWDTSYGKIVRIPVTEPVMNQYLDQNGQMQFSQQEKPVYDEFGSPVFSEIPLGDNAVDIIDPFRIIVDPNATNEFSMNWIMETSIQKLSWIRENYDKQEPGFTGLANEVKEEENLSNLISLRQRLKTLSTKGDGSWGAPSAQPMVKNSAVVKELYVRPTRAHPKGMMIVAAGGKILYRGDSPYYDGGSDSWHPYSFFRYETIPGRFFGKSLLEDLIEIQKRLNAIDALVIYNRKTMVSPQRLIPHGSGIPEGYWNGAPGLQLQYRPVGANGAKPEIIQGAQLPAQVYQEREIAKNEFHQIARVNEVLQGIRPPGVYSGVQYQLMLEQTFSSFGPTINRLEKFIERGQTKKLKLIAHRYREPRPEFINKLRAMNKDISDVEIVNFIGSDLRNNCSVRIEAGSSVPRSKAAQQQQIMELAQQGILGDLINDPVGKQKFLERIGVSGFDVNFEPDTKRAQWENEMMDDGSFEGIAVFPIDNHGIHITIHGNRMKEPSFMKIDPQIQQMYMMHIQQHQQLQQQQMFEQAQQNALMQGNLPGGMAQGMQQQHAPQQASRQPKAPEQQAAEQERVLM